MHDVTNEPSRRPREGGMSQSRRPTTRNYRWNLKQTSARWLCDLTCWKLGLKTGHDQPRSQIFIKYSTACHLTRFQAISFQTEKLHLLLNLYYIFSEVYTVLTLKLYWLIRWVKDVVVMNRFRPKMRQPFLGFEPLISDDSVIRANDGLAGLDAEGRKHILLITETGLCK